MIKFPDLKKILRRYEDTGYSQYQRARIFFMLNTVAIALLVIVIAFVLIANKKINLKVLIALITCMLFLVSTLKILSKGHFFLAANLFIVMIMSSVWLTIFFDRNSPVIRLDTIAYILGLLPLASLISLRKRRPIVIYGLTNIIVLIFFIYFTQDEITISSFARFDYLIDNILSLIFIITLNFQIVTINNHSLKVAESEIIERKNAELELIDKNTELENMNQQYLATMEELEATNEEYEAQHREILQSQHDLLESEQRFRNILEFLPLPIVLMSLEDIIFINQAYTMRYGYTAEDFPSVEQAWSLVFPDTDYQADILKEYYEILNTTQKNKTITIKPKQYTCKNGTEAIVEISITTTGTERLMVVDDITDKVHSQQLLIQSEKMMTVGNLAAGMAHEINNPLGIILQSVQNTFRRLSPENEKNTTVAQELKADLGSINTYLEKRDITKYLKAIQEASKRAATIVSNMLHFTRKSDSELIPLEINELIDRSIELATQDYDLKKNYDLKKIKFTRNFDQDMPKIPGIRNELEQVILNLVKNAAQAMYGANQNTEEKEIAITTSRVTGMIKIEIQDSGPGIPEEIIKHIFEPFYTTKKAGTGTGLGLFVCYSIITNRHNGEISVNSSPGKGTIFTLRLPQ